MARLLFNWLINALALILISYLVPGFSISGIGPALIAALVIGLLNATLGFFLKVVTFPLSILTLGLFLLVINALMLELASRIALGFHIAGFLPAFIGAILLAIIQMLFRDPKVKR
jgi:putative membrane protein